MRCESSIQTSRMLAAVVLLAALLCINMYSVSGYSFPGVAMSPNVQLVSKGFSGLGMFDPLEDGEYPETNNGFRLAAEKRGWFSGNLFMITMAVKLITPSMHLKIELLVINETCKTSRLQISPKLGCFFQFAR